MGGGASEPQPSPPPQPNNEANVEEPPAQDNKKTKKKVIINHTTNQKSPSNQRDIQEQPKQNTKSQLFNVAPKCINNRPSTYACVSKKCKDFPFFCLECEGECEERHHHNNKSSSIRLKQLQKRIQNKKMVGETLKESLQSYQNILEVLQETFDNFYQKQIQMLSQIQTQKDLSPQSRSLKRKIQKGEKSGITGSKLKQLWDQEACWKQQEQKLIQFLVKKKELLSNMHECFSNINQISQKQQQHHPSPKSQPQQKQQKKKNVNSKAWHLYKRYQIDSNSLQISKEGVWSSKNKVL